MDDDVDAVAAADDDDDDIAQLDVNIKSQVLFQVF